MVGMVRATSGEWSLHTSHVRAERQGCCESSSSLERARVTVGEVRRSQVGVWAASPLSVEMVIAEGCAAPSAAV